MLAAFEAAEAAIAPVYTMREVLADPHVQARDVFVEVDGVVMQGPVAAAVAHAGARCGWAGRPLGADTEDVLGELDDLRDHDRDHDYRRGISNFAYGGGCGRRAGRCR